MSQLIIEVLGGGVIGVSVAYHLARRGVASTVADLGNFTSQVFDICLRSFCADSSPSQIIAIDSFSLRNSPQKSAQTKYKPGVQNGSQNIKSQVDHAGVASCASGRAAGFLARDWCDKAEAGW